MARQQPHARDEGISLDHFAFMNKSNGTRVADLSGRKRTIIVKFDQKASVPILPESKMNLDWLDARSIGDQVPPSVP